MPKRNSNHASEQQKASHERPTRSASLGPGKKGAVALERARFYLDLARDPSLLYALVGPLQISELGTLHFEMFVSRAYDVPNFQSEWLPIKPKFRPRFAKQRGRNPKPTAEDYAQSERCLELAWQHAEAREAWFVGWMLRIPSELEVLDYVMRLGAGKRVANPWAHKDDDILLVYEYLSRELPKRRTEIGHGAFREAVGSHVMNAYDASKRPSGTRRLSETERLDAATGAALHVRERTVREARTRAQARATRASSGSKVRYRDLRLSRAKELAEIPSEVRSRAVAQPAFLGKSALALSQDRRRLLYLFRTYGA